MQKEFRGGNENRALFLPAILVLEALNAKIR